MIVKVNFRAVGRFSWMKRHTKLVNTSIRTFYHRHLVPQTSHDTFHQCCSDNDFRQTACWFSTTTTPATTYQFVVSSWTEMWMTTRRSSTRQLSTSSPLRLAPLSPISCVVASSCSTSTTGFQRGTFPISALKAQSTMGTRWKGFALRIVR